MIKKLKRKCGFTLAEVLLTLVIIGVISAITIPVAMNNTRNQQYKSAFKKAISAIAYSISMNWTHKGKSVSDYSSEEELYNEIFSKHLVIFDRTDQFTTDDCVGLVFRTNDGYMYCVQNFYSGGGAPDLPCDAADANPCIQANEPNLWIDVNGEKGPNKPTESEKQPSDIYQAQIFSRSVVPFGDASYKIMYE